MTLRLTFLAVAVGLLLGCTRSDARFVCKTYLHCAAGTTEWDSLDAQARFGPQGTCWDAHEEDRCLTECFTGLERLPQEVRDEDPRCDLDADDYDGLLTQEIFEELFEELFCPAWNECNTFEPCQIEFVLFTGPECRFDAQAASTCLAGPIECSPDFGFEFPALPDACFQTCAF